jgi:uncharacterized membrane protein
VVLAAGVWVLACGLFPQLRTKTKLPLSTSVVTGIILFAFGIVFLGLELTLAAMAQFVNSVIWFVLLIQEK